MKNKIRYVYPLLHVCLLLFAELNITDIHAVNDSKYPFHPSVNLPFSSSNLPIVVIELDERMADKEQDKRVSATMKIIWNEDGKINYLTDTENIDYAGKIGIKYRGNSSFLNSDKKPFAVRTQDDNGKKKNVSILGMPEDNDWALLAPYTDKSMIRDILLFELMRGTMDYVPSGKYCELVLNGVYQGIYIMTARVRQGEHRLNIEAPTADEGDGLTGGYHLEIDRNDDPGFWGIINAKSPSGNELGSKPFYQFKYPDEEDLSAAQKNYIINLVWEMEMAIAGEQFKDMETGYRAYLDTASVMDYYIAQEISKNPDAYRLSTPLYKYPNSVDKRFKFSIWDFNISMGNADYLDGWSTEGWAYNNNRFSEENKVPYMFKRLLQDEVFHINLKKRWAYYRENRFTNENIMVKIDSLISLLHESQERNFAIWNRFDRYVWPNYYIGSSWNDEINYLKEWLIKRVEWIDTQWSQEEVNFIANGDFEASLPKGNNVEAWLSEWTKAGTVSLATGNAHNGNYCLLLRRGSKVYQTVTELTPGKYTLKAWVRTTSDPGASMYIKYMDKNNLSTEMTKNIEGNKDYHLIEINNIDISNNFVEVGFNTQDKLGDIRLRVDDIELVKQSGTVSNEIITEPADTWVNISMNRQQLELHISIINDMKGYPEVVIYDITGRIVYHKKLSSQNEIIRNIFVPNTIYIVQAGNEVKKIIF